MQILIKEALTRTQRMLLCSKAIEEAEKHGHGKIEITIHNSQIVDLDLNKGNRFGNCSQEWYESE